MNPQDERGAAMARMLNGEVATPELLSVVTGLDVTEVLRLAAEAKPDDGGHSDETLTADDLVYLKETYAGSADPEVQEFLKLHAPRRPAE